MRVYSFSFLRISWNCSVCIYVYILLPSRTNPLSPYRLTDALLVQDPPSKPIRERLWKRWGAQKLSCDSLPPLRIIVKGAYSPFHQFLMSSLVRNCLRVEQLVCIFWCECTEHSVRLQETDNLNQNTIKHRTADINSFPACFFLSQSWNHPVVGMGSSTRPDPLPKTESPTLTCLPS